MQNRAVELFANLLDETTDNEHTLFTDYLDFTERHQQMIAHFGHFPHHNTILDHLNTDEEQTFLREPNSRF